MHTRRHVVILVYRWQDLEGTGEDSQCIDWLPHPDPELPRPKGDALVTVLLPASGSILRGRSDGMILLVRPEIYGKPLKRRSVRSTQSLEMEESK